MNPTALHGLALSQLRNDEYAAAARTIRRLLLVIPPEHAARPQLLTVLAFALAESGELGEAERVARHALELDPKSAVAWREVRRLERAKKAS